LHLAIKHIKRKAKWLNDLLAPVAILPSKTGVAILVIVSLSINSSAQNIITTQNDKGVFPIVSSEHLATIICDKPDDTLVQKAAGILQNDIALVSGKTLEIANHLNNSRNVIIIGNIHQSPLLKQLIKNKRLNVDSLNNKWEGYQIQVIHSPFTGVDNALVIAGSDRRGTAFGAFELSKQIGVSPWYWWADVPVKTKKEIYVKANAFLRDAPKVKYRGIFINDEAPALSNWSKEKFGGFNHLFYEKVFELMLRLKANYLWPAMWGNAFYDDDPLNKQTADNYGIVIGTSHHEPLMRAHDEWRRYGSGKWNYDSNAVRLQEFWKAGMQRATNEKIVSIGMRGDGDEPMSRETATALLEKIVKDQRNIIKEVTGKPASATPQLWALYKEVQDYYDKGMRVPDDVTLLLCDDNWGNIRKLPRLTDKPRAGGYGIYYHFDYVGGPRNYKWINTNNISRVWEQMHLAWEYNARQIWIANVGDIKPMEFPISFFLDYAWDPTKWNEDNLENYFTSWSAAQFGNEYSKLIGELIQKYSQYNARRKPELLDANTFSLTHYHELTGVNGEYDQLLIKAQNINEVITAEYKDAYFQLVLHPIQASANLYQLYTAVAYNNWFASQNTLAANKQADKARRSFIKDSLITVQYHTIANGKWNHMMDQVHIGYTYWQQPPFNKMPSVENVLAENAEEGVTIITPKSKTAEDLIKDTGKVFYEKDGYVSMEAANWTNAINNKNINWKIIPGIGRTGSGITTFPVTYSSNLSPNSPRVEYTFYTYDSGDANIHLYFSPTLNFHNDEGLKYAVSVDNEQPQIFILNKEDNNVRTWEKWVADNIIIKKSTHQLIMPGKHVLKYWMISPAIVLQKLVVDLGGMKPSYLGPPETLKQ
jgi:hypothetical protein